MPIYPPTTESVTSASPVTCSVVPSIPVPTHGSGGTFAVLAKTSVSAPPLSVLNLIRDTTTWSQWNSFCPACEIHPPKGSAPSLDLDPSIKTGKERWLELGSVATIDVFMSGDGLVPGRKRSRTQGVIITVLCPLNEAGKKGYRIAWKSTGYSHWQLHSERVMEFLEIALDNGMIGTEYSCWETFGGLLGPVVKSTFGSNLVDRFGDYASDVRGYFEKDEEVKGEGNVDEQKEE
jgi:hypothetical protein